MSDDHKFTDVVSGPIMPGDQAKRNQAVRWEEVCSASVGTDVRNYHYWHFRRPVAAQAENSK